MSSPRFAVGSSGPAEHIEPPGGERSTGERPTDAPTSGDFGGDALRSVLGGLRNAAKRPPDPRRPPPPAVKVLVALVAVTAIVTALVDVTNLAATLTGAIQLDDHNNRFGVVVRTIWAVARSIGFGFLLIHLWRGRAAARALGLVLTVATAFSVLRFSTFAGDWPDIRVAVTAGFGVVLLLCVADLTMLLAVRSVRAHLVRRPPKRHIPTWLIGTRVLVVSLVPLMLVPCLVATGDLFGDPRLPLAAAVPLVVAWFAFTLGLNTILSWVTLFLLRGHRWARTVVGAVCVLIVATQPLLCYLLLGWTGAVRDGAPIAIAAAFGFYGLYGDARTREYFVRRGRTAP